MAQETMDKINIAEILKDCPKGMELYSPICGKCALKNVNNNPKYPILAHTTGEILTLLRFTADGRHCDTPDAECLLFPAKDQRDWSKFQRPFKDGDILSNGICICIYNGNESKNYYGLYVGVGHIDYPNYFIFSTQNSYFTKKNAHLATEEEKEKLFQAIKDNGYKWNAETKTLEKFCIEERETIKEEKAGGFVCDTEDISYDIAQILKEKGFDWETTEVYERNTFACRYEDVAKPTISQVLNWLRKVHRCDLNAIWDKQQRKWYFRWQMMDEPVLRGSYISQSIYDTYENAVVQGIRKKLVGLEI